MNFIGVVIGTPIALGIALSLLIWTTLLLAKGSRAKKIFVLSAFWLVSSAFVILNLHIIKVAADQHGKEVGLYGIGSNLVFLVYAAAFERKRIDRIRSLIKQEG